jgi:menaquinol-cytochrome c reductase iron-sulfur subunit
MEDRPNAAEPPRRRFLEICTSALLAAIALLIAIPGLGFFFAPLRRRRGGGAATGRFEYVGAIDELPPGKWTLLPLKMEEQDGWEKHLATYSVWARREGDGSLSVFSPICPHLGCHINWLPAKNEFHCPCHGGTYNANGDYVSGPPPRSMDPLPFRVEGGRLLVEWESFEIGTPQRVVVRVG